MGEHGSRGGDGDGAWERAGSTAVGAESMDDAGLEGWFVGEGLKVEGGKVGLKRGVGDRTECRRSREKSNVEVGFGQKQG